ncbi:PRC-barrel domain-containing protein [Azospirillum sp.]|uniref:PRC-barrel domain-containing protein n=1 Tax=Azospirillum sp. TaxID=34012 RepID=UPI003D723624
MPFSDLARALLLALAVMLATPPAHAASCPDPNSLAVIGGVELSDLDDLIERPVVSAEGHLVGAVRDVVLDPCGTPASLVVALPYTHKDVAIPIDRVRYNPDSEVLRLDGLTDAAVAALPPTDGAAVSLDRK